jgi:MFS family permease
MLVGARVVQGIGAAMMAPAALSILTTTFREGPDRFKALGAWGAMAGLASAAGVFFGGALSDGPGWRWVLLVNLPVCAVVVVGAFRLVPGERRRAQLAHFDALGAILATAGMLLLVYALVKAPERGWGNATTIGELGTAGLILSIFALNELRHGNPLSIGLGAVFVGVITAANAGVPSDKAGLAASLINSSQQLGAALGLAIFSAIATAGTTDALATAQPDRLQALTAGYRDAILACAIFVLAAAVVALRAANPRGEVDAPVPVPAAAHGTAS